MKSQTLPLYESQNGYFKKTKHVKFSEKTNISNPLIRTPTVRIRGLEMFVFWKICSNYGRYLTCHFPLPPLVRWWETY